MKLYEKLNWREQKKANKYIEVQKENKDYDLTDKEKKELPDVVKEELLETLLNHNAGKNLEMSVVGKNSAALKCTFLAFLACLIIQY